MLSFMAVNQGHIENREEKKPYVMRKKIIIVLCHNASINVSSHECPSV